MTDTVKGGTDIRAARASAGMSVPRPTVENVTDTVGSDALPDIAGVPLRDLSFTVVDIETTGWSPEEAGITEVGAVLLRRGEVVAEFASLVNPGTPVPASITELTGISDQMLAVAPPVASVLPGLLAFAEGTVLAAHNAPFDLGFLTVASAAAGLIWPGFAVLDTVRLARHLMVTPDEVPDCKLRTLADFFGTPVQPSHRALADARATAAVLGHLLRRLADREIYTLGELTTWLAAREADAAAAQAAAARAAARAAAKARPGWLRRLAARVSRRFRGRREDKVAALPGRQPQPAKTKTGRQHMVTAIVLIKAEIQRIPEVAEVVAQIPAVSEVYSITGDYDLVAIVRVRAHDELADVIPGGLNKVPGVTATQTHIAFRTYSRHDLESAFSIGLADQ
jgi:DNA polymerase III epsilon subunit family exonuclease